MALWKEVLCPACRTPGAQKLLWRVKCRRPGCPHYDAALAGAPAAPRAAPARARRPLAGSFDPGDRRIEIRYRNHAGEEKTLIGDRATLRRRGEHFSLRLAPTGKRCALARERMLNLAQVEAALPAEERAALTGVERQIIGYHRKHGSTSPRLEQIRRKWA